MSLESYPGLLKWTGNRNSQRINISKLVKVTFKSDFEVSLVQRVKSLDGTLA
ncbi:hypothetical protein PVL30_003861 [Lodderomyces elongisporus]|uniref:uncharacterized protein n=1 Tax=Lodderomyces elongisporus TaxID=36914 RepID=UPI002924F1F5|nr:uncharacterized protein PVL30_003861 [Lodderomyces elongisporus]WLF80088.1 hypothetical protein PVL30_003861 [Lodderomyces elongisporus]